MSMIIAAYLQHECLRRRGAAPFKQDTICVTIGQALREGETRPHLAEQSS